MIELPLAQYRFCFKAESDILLPAYSGSSWRGLFGHQLKRTVCVTREKNCKECLLWRSCVYTYLFETPPAADALMMKKYPAAPHPYIIQPNPQQKRQIAKGEALHFDLTLIGKANQHLPYIIHTYQQAGKSGIGAQRGKFSLSHIMQKQAEDEWQTIYTDQGKLQALSPQTPIIPQPDATDISLKLHTPCRIRIKNHYIHAEEFEFKHLFGNLLRRLSSLSYFHNNKELQLDYALLVEKAQQVSFSNAQLHWQDWIRYSSRQQSKLQMGGVVGEVQLKAKQIEDFWEILYLGQYLNIGKGSVMGLGHYSLDF